jgi:hypothetical protein
LSEAGLDVIGLVLNAIGGLVMFVWGPPQPSFEKRSKLLMRQNAEDLRDDVMKVALEKRHRRMFKLGLGLIILGFLLQLPIALRPVLGV